MSQHFKQKIEESVQFLSTTTDRPVAKQDMTTVTHHEAISALETKVTDALHTIYDPEIRVNIYDLGLIYHCQVDSDSGVVNIEMTLTAPGCPVAQTFPGMVAARIREVDGVSNVDVQLVWEPPWTQERMSDAARLELGLF